MEISGRFISSELLDTGQFDPGPALRHRYNGQMRFGSTQDNADAASGPKKCQATSKGAKPAAPGKGKITLLKFTLPMVPGGQAILATTPCLVLGQEMSMVTRGLQYSTRMSGSLGEGGGLLSSSGTKPLCSVWTGAETVVVVLGHWLRAVVVAGPLVVLVLAVVDSLATVVGRVVVLVVVVVVST